MMFALWVAAAQAYDFSVAVPTGQTLYFNYVQGGVEVVYPNATAPAAQGWNGFVRPTGVLCIPDSVGHDTQRYAVRRIAGHAFFGCNGLVQVTVGEGVETIGGSAFYGCTSLAEVTLPSTVDTIGHSVFYGCTSLTDFTIRRSTPPYTAATAFGASSVGGCTLHVPCMSMEAYLMESTWSQFGTATDEGCHVQISATANHEGRGTVTGGGSYASGTAVVLSALPSEGFFFVCWDDGDTLNPRIVSAMRDSSFVAMFFAMRYDTIRSADTVRMVDTLYPSFFRLVVGSDNPMLGIGVGNMVLPAGTQAEIAALPLEGGRFRAWSDGSTENPRRVTLTGDAEYVALFDAAAVTAAEAAWQAEVDGRRLTVRCPAGETVRLFDAAGRQLFAHAVPTNGCLGITLPSAGVYLVQVGTLPARKVVSK